MQLSGRIIHSKIQKCKLVVRVNKSTDKTVFTFSINGKEETQTITNTGWQEIKFTDIPLKQGPNEIKLSVAEGTISFDWINIVQ